MGSVTGAGGVSQAPFYLAQASSQKLSDFITVDGSPRIRALCVTDPELMDLLRQAKEAGFVIRDNRDGVTSRSNELYVFQGNKLQGSVAIFANSGWQGELKSLLKKSLQPSSPDKGSGAVRFSIPPEVGSLLKSWGFQLEGDTLEFSTTFGKLFPDFEGGIDFSPPPDRPDAVEVKMTRQPGNILWIDVRHKDGSAERVIIDNTKGGEEIEVLHFNPYGTWNGQTETYRPK